MNVALVGASGYGEYYLSLFEEYIDENEYPICGVIDPFAKNSPKYDWIVEKKIPVYDSLEDFYKNDTAGLVMLVSPIAFHRDQSLLVMKHGSALLCEKPLAATMRQAHDMRDLWIKTGVPFGVGFQWSFSRTMQSLKSDIMNGLYGKPISLKTHVSWKRPDSYYTTSSWKGRIKDSHGRHVYDSITMNATAHFLHNMFFIIGNKMNESAMPGSIAGSVYRGRDIESYDTVFLRGAFADGCRFLFTASHVGEFYSNPRFVYEFENGTVTYEGDKSGEVSGEFKNGEKRVYGVPQSRQEDAYKLYAMLEAAKNRTQPVCTPDTAMPHLAVCMAAAHEMPIKMFPKHMTAREFEPESVHIKGLCEAMDAFFKTEMLPDEQGLVWAEKSRLVSIDPK